MARFNEGNLTFQIVRVLPDRHPSRSYTAELERRLRDVEGVFVQSHPAEVSWSSHISTAAEINSPPNNLIHPVNEFSSKGNRASYFTEDGCHIDPINLIEKMRGLLFSLLMLIKQEFSAGEFIYHKCVSVCASEHCALSKMLAVPKIKFPPIKKCLMFEKKRKVKDVPNQISLSRSSMCLQPLSQKRGALQ